MKIGGLAPLMALGLIISMMAEESVVPNLLVARQMYLAEAVKKYIITILSYYSNPIFTGTYHPK